jgi:tetratricopeptide (TPR) repeat protein
MRRSLPALAFVAALVALQSALPLAAQDEGAASPYVQGLAALEQENYADAVKLLAQVVAQEPNNEPAWFNLGVARFKLKPPDLPGALEAFRKALALAGNRPRTRLYIGRIYEAQGAYAEAIKMYEDEVTRTAGAHKNDANVALGRVEYAAGQYSDALVAERLAVAAEPKYVEGLYWLGLAQTALQQYADAIKTFQNAKLVLQDYADLKAGLGRMKPEQQRERKQTEEKLAQDYGRAQEFAQDLGLWPALNKALGEAYLGDRQYDMARVSYRAALDKNQLGNPVDADVQVRLARAYLADARNLFETQNQLYTCVSVMGSAEQASDKAIELDAKSAAAYEAQGEIYAFEAATYTSDPKQKIVSHTYDDALASFAKALQLQPDSAQALMERAGTYLAVAQEETPGSDKAKQALQAARGDLQQALTLQPNLPSAYVTLAQVALAEEKYDQAQQYAEKAMNLDPKDPAAYNAAGLVDYFTGRLAEAARYFRRGLELNDTSAQLHFNLGNTFFQMQSWYLALREYRNALDHTPSPAVAKTSFQRSYILYQMALAYHETQRYDAEIGALNDSLALDASYFEAYMQLARAYAAKQEYRGAQRALEQAQSKAPSDGDSSRAFTLSGQIYEMAGDPHSAAVAYASAAQKDPNNVIAKQGLARLSGQ